VRDAAARLAAARQINDSVVEDVGMRKRLASVTVAALLLAASAGCSYNKFTAQEQAIKGSWSEVENQLQRRHDLIPNLVETTKGFAAQEKSVFDGIAEARSKMAGAQTPADKIAAGNAESSALARLLVVVENYPTLKSDQTFMRLMDELSGTENRLAVARMRYNQQVQTYNTLRHSFPANMTGKIFGFQEEYPYFEAPADAKAAPKVDFGK
jgi:LemA protein